MVFHSTISKLTIAASDVNIVNILLCNYYVIPDRCKNEFYALRYLENARILHERFGIQGQAG